MPGPPDPRTFAQEMAALCSAAPFLHGGRPCLRLTLPGFPGARWRHWLLVTEADGTLTARHAAGADIPDARRLAALAGDGPRDRAAQLSAFTEGLYDAPPPWHAVRRAAGTRAAHGSGQAERRAFAEAAAAHARAPVAALVDAALDASGLAREHVAALRALRRLRAPPRQLLLAMLGGPGRLRASAVEACAAHPLAVELAAEALDSPAAAEGWLREGAAGFAGACAARVPGLLPARLARLGQTGLGDLPPPSGDRPGSFDGFLGLVAHAPPDWIVPDPAALHAMLEVSEAFLHLSRHPRADPATLLRPVRGDWPAFAARCRKAADPDGAAWRVNPIARAADVALDPATNLSLTVMLPLLARSEPGGRLPESWSMRCLVAAQALLYGGKGMPAVLAGSTLWHARSERIAASTPTDAPSSWEPPCGPFEASNGVVVRPLCSAAALVAEGAAGVDADGVPGLDHCVATYRARAFRGECHILSLRAPAGGARLSTAEVTVGADGVGRLAQLRGLRNGEPPPEAVEAMAEFTASVRLPVPAAPPAGLPATPVSRFCGYDNRDEALVRLAALAYAEFLPRHLRDGDLDRLAAHVGFAPVPREAPDAGDEGPPPPRP